MQNTKLILLEGLPGTGKSTNAYFLSRQLELNGYACRWIHEVARPHPVLFFDEASLTYEQYHAFTEQYPQAEPALRKTSIFRKNAVGIDLMELEWKYPDTVPPEALRHLRQFDVWNFPLARYKETAFEKWTHFVETVLEDHRVYLLDSAIFQFQIFTFLLKNIPFDEWQNFVLALLDILRPLCPKLIYFYREDPEDAIRFLEERRGIQFMEDIWRRDQNEPYYKGRPKGAEGHRQFLRDYARIAKALFDLADCRKLAVEITGQDWESRENSQLNFAGLTRKPYFRACPPEGTYRNEPTGFILTVQGNELMDPCGVKRALTPKSAQEFYVDSLPVLLLFDGPDSITVAGDQIAERWTATGTEFVKVPGNVSCGE